MIIVFYSNHSGLSFSVRQPILRLGHQVCHVGKEENLVIDSFGFLVCEAFVFIVETTGEGHQTR